MIKSKFYKVFIGVLTITLMVLNGIEINFKVDHYTIIFFSILSLPVLFDLIEGLTTKLKVKAGKYQAEFTSKPLKEQIFIFLNGIIYHHQWTFYETRQGETQLGKAFYILISDLQQNYRSELYRDIKRWLSSENDNVVWFASEIVGYFKIEEFKKDLKKRVKIDKLDVPLSNADLNCLWAYSRFNNYKELVDFFETTTNEKNLKWIMYAFYQMSKSKHGDPIEFIPSIEEKLERNDISEKLREVASETLKRLKVIQKKSHKKIYK